MLLLWIVFLVAVPFFAWSKVDKVAFEPDGDRPDEPARDDVPPGRQRLARRPHRRGAQGLGTGNAKGQRTDTIMLLHTGSGPNLLMSIPRDSHRRHPGHGTNKINAAYAFGGPKLLVRTHRARHRHPDRRLRRDRARRLRRASWTRSAASRSARRPR